MKRTDRNGENTGKQCDWQRIDLKNLQTAHAAQYQNQTLNERPGRGPKQTFLQRRHKDVQEEHEKMLNIAKY